MEEQKKCPWWLPHDWIYLGVVSIVQPKRGPFDPRSDLRRTVDRRKYVCSQCGKEKLRRYTDSGLSSWA